jgi:Flp pilus assembly pilin Flp
LGEFAAVQAVGFASVVSLKPFSRIGLRGAAALCTGRCVMLGVPIALRQGITKSAVHAFFLKGTAMTYLKKFLAEDKGQDMVEYGLLAAFISIVAIAALTAIGPLVNAVYVNIQNALP